MPEIKVGAVNDLVQVLAVVGAAVQGAGRHPHNRFRICATAFINDLIYSAHRLQGLFFAKIRVNARNEKERRRR